MAAFIGKHIEASLLIGLDSLGLRTLKESELILPGAAVYNLVSLTQSDIAGIFEFVNNKFLPKPFYVVGSKIVFYSPTVAQTIVLAKQALSCVHASVGLAKPIELFIVKNKYFDFKPIQVQSINWLTNEVGNGTFSIDGKTNWQASLVLPENVTNFFYRLKSTKKGLSLSDTITTNYTAYLKV